jgi:hypothetical protein
MSNALQAWIQKSYEEDNLQYRGSRVGSLLILEILKERQGASKMAFVRCNCGVEKKVQLSKLTRAKYPTRSCGCENPSRRTHGLSRTPEYTAWLMMQRRCSDASYESYYNYGGRGISVCERWTSSFENFLEDMGLRPGPNYSLDRKDNNGNYEPSNCRWATELEQAHNTSQNVKITIGDKTLCKQEWIRLLGIPPSGTVTKERILREYEKKHETAYKKE